MHTLSKFIINKWYSVSALSATLGNLTNTDIFLYSSDKLSTFSLTLGDVLGSEVLTFLPDSGTNPKER